VEVSGECGGRWVLCREEARWVFAKTAEGSFASRVTMPQTLAWRLFTKGITRGSALEEVEITGNRDLGEHVVHLTAIVG
jgi:hypothetical protein